jgi:long-chain acyl-CoA synthetase
MPDGQQGLLLAAGPGVMGGYWQDAEATRRAFVDGWFDTGGEERGGRVKRVDMT